jgi:Flp pilus assembly pilin Flp
MEIMTRKAIAAQVITTAYITGLIGRMRDDDRGQASTEYAGILFVVVAIITALIALGFGDVGQAIKGKIVAAITKLGG